MHELDLSKTQEESEQKEKSEHIFFDIAANKVKFLVFLFFKKNLKKLSNSVKGISFT